MQIQTFLSLDLKNHFGFFSVLSATRLRDSLAIILISESLGMISLVYLGSNRLLLSSIRCRSSLRYYLCVILDQSFMKLFL